MGTGGVHGRLAWLYNASLHRHPTILTHPSIHSPTHLNSQTQTQTQKALTPQRLDRIPDLLPALTPLLASEDTLRRASASASLLVRSQHAAEWEVAAEKELHPERLRAWSSAFDSTVSAGRLGLLMDAAWVLLSPDRALLRRIVLALIDGRGSENTTLTTSNPTGNSHDSAAAEATEAAGAAGTINRIASIIIRPDVVPPVWSPDDLSAALALADATLSPATIGAFAALGDELMQPERLQAVAAALDSALPTLPQTAAAAAAAAAADAGRVQVLKPLPPLLRSALRTAARSGLAARWVKALAAAVSDPSGRGAAVRVADAAVAGGWQAQLSSAPAAVRLVWSFHVHLLLRV